MQTKTFLHQLYQILNDQQYKNLISWVTDEETAFVTMNPGDYNLRASHPSTIKTSTNNAADTNTPVFNNTLNRTHQPMFGEVGEEEECFVFKFKPYDTDFENQILKNYFKHGKISSFIRQLHMYGFHKLNKQYSSARTVVPNDIYYVRETTPKSEKKDANATTTISTTTTTTTTTTTGTSATATISTVDGLTDDSASNNKTKTGTQEGQVDSKSKNKKKDLENSVWYFSHGGRLFHKKASVKELNQIQRKSTLNRKKGLLQQQQQQQQQQQNGASCIPTTFSSITNPQSISNLLHSDPNTRPFTPLDKPPVSTNKDDNTPNTNQNVTTFTPDKRTQSLSGTSNFFATALASTNITPNVRELLKKRAISAPSITHSPTNAVFPHQYVPPSNSNIEENNASKNISDSNNISNINTENNNWKNNDKQSTEVINKVQQPMAQLTALQEEAPQTSFMQEHLHIRNPYMNSILTLRQAVLELTDVIESMANTNTTFSSSEEHIKVLQKLEHIRTNVSNTIPQGSSNDLSNTQSQQLEHATWPQLINSTPTTHVTTASMANIAQQRSQQVIPVSSSNINNASNIPNATRHTSLNSGAPLHLESSNRSSAFDLGSSSSRNTSYSAHFGYGHANSSLGTKNSFQMDHQQNPYAQMFNLQSATTTENLPLPKHLAHSTETISPHDHLPPAFNSYSMANKSTDSLNFSVPTAILQQQQQQQQQTNILPPINTSNTLQQYSSQPLAPLPNKLSSKPNPPQNAGTALLNPGLTSLPTVGNTSPQHHSGPSPLNARFSVHNQEPYTQNQQVLQHSQGQHSQNTGTLPYDSTKEFQNNNKQ